MTLDVNIHLVDSIDEVMELKRWMSEHRPFIAVDTETEGLQWWRHRPRMLQVGDRDTAWAIPWHLWGGAILEVLRDFEGELVMHNAKFDVMMFEHWSGVRLPWERIHDTCVMAHIIDPTRPVGLKALAERMVDQRAATSQRVLSDAMTLYNWDWDTVPLDFQPYWVYAGMDAILTSRLFEILHPKVMLEAPAAYELEMGTLFVLMEMERRGVAVDLDYTREKLRDFERYVDQAADWCLQEYGVRAGSNPAVIERLKRDVPASVYPFDKLTPAGALCLDKDVLEEVIDATGHPLARVVLQRRRIQKLSSAYLRNFIKLEHGGRLHPNFNPVQMDSDRKAKGRKGYGAKTGRMSVSDPSLQNLPRRSNSNPAADAVRNCLTASEGRTLILSDFDQVEFRLLAHLSGDRGLARAFEEGDFFVNLTREMFADPTIQKGDPRRQTTKNAGYAKIYGAGIPKFAVTAGISLDNAQAIMHRMDELYPGIGGFTREVERVAREREGVGGRPYVISPLTGRRHYCHSDQYYVLVNYLIQGGAAEVLKRKNLELYRAGVGEYLVLDVHDEVILDVPHEELPDVAGAVGGVMNDHELFTVPLTASIDLAERWGAKGG